MAGAIGAEFPYRERHEAVTLLPPRSTVPRGEELTSTALEE
jgi:hypothetical protein